MLNKKEPLKILIISLPLGRIPPPVYGGIERTVSALVYGLKRRGHVIHLIAHKDSTAPVDLFAYPQQKNAAGIDTIINASHIMRCLMKCRDIDIIHNFSRLAYLLPAFIKKVPKIHTYELPITPRSLTLGKALAGPYLTFTACSQHCANTENKKIKVLTIHKSVAPGAYTATNINASTAPLAFLGRLHRQKGVHTAIAVAKKTNRKLIIAGFKSEEGPERDYFLKDVAPHLADGKIEFIGPVDDIKKNELLGKCAALLFPIEWDEPFGMVMIEALACGTPVIAFDRGAVREVIEDSKNGFICATEEDMVNAVKKLPDIERKTCRHTVEDKFSDDFIVSQYEELYYKALRTCRRKK